jgi:hypothetical protein
VNKQVKQFFFEKKNQKTFAPLRAVLKAPGTPGAKKFFAELFFKKATSSFLYLGNCT